MSEELVNTIVRKLDIAVTGAYEWALKAVAQYCTLSMLKSWAWVLVGMAVCVTIIIFCNYCRKNAIERLNDLAHENHHLHQEAIERERKESVWEWTFLTSVAVTVAAIFLVLLGSTAIGWTFFPDAMLLKSI